MRGLKNWTFNKDEYLPDMFTDDDRLYRLKILLGGLNEIDTTIMFLYIELGSMRKVGKMLQVSTSTACREINRIKKCLLLRL